MTTPPPREHILSALRLRIAWLREANQRSAKTAVPTVAQPPQHPTPLPC